MYYLKTKKDPPIAQSFFRHEMMLVWQHHCGMWVRMRGALPRMKTTLLFPLIILLTGCPGKGKEGAQYGERRAIHIDGNRICFTVDKTDVLESYNLSSDASYYNKVLQNYSASLSYPNTCFTVNLEKAVIYGADYILNQKSYSYTFIIDNDGQAIDIGGMAVCPYPNDVSGTSIEKD